MDDKSLKDNVFMTYEGHRTMKKNICIAFVVGLIIGIIIPGPYVPLGDGLPDVVNTWTGSIKRVEYH